MKQIYCLLILLPILAACDTKETSTEDTSTNVPAEQSTKAQPHQVDIVIKGLDFTAPDQIESGWTTFNLDNQSAMIHFAVIERLPDGIGIEDQQADVAPVFQDGFNLLNEGKVDEAMAAFGKLPAWFGDVIFYGGPGLLSGGERSSATVNLQPGTYLLECYVKTGGIFHSYNPSPNAWGMVHEFEVTKSAAESAPPEPTIRVTIASTSGITVEGPVPAGEHIVEVNFADQKVHENFVGHDVNLVRLETNADLETLNQWMDWRNPKGLESPAPATFIGGLAEMPAGETGYFSATLTPGRYAWISETADPMSKGMLEAFTVAAE